MVINGQFDTFAHQTLDGGVLAELMEHTIHVAIFDPQIHLISRSGHQLCQQNSETRECWQLLRSPLCPQACRDRAVTAAADDICWDQSRRCELDAPRVAVIHPGDSGPSSSATRSRCLLTRFRRARDAPPQPLNKGSSVFVCATDFR